MSACLAGRPREWPRRQSVPIRVDASPPKRYRGRAPPGSSSGSVSADSWTGSSSTRSSSGTTCSPDEGSYPATTVAGLETNTLWDGLFHAATWVAVAGGIYILWRRTTDRRWAISGRAFIGWMLVGWGLFNLVEGIVDHHILGIHHVRETGNQTAWDLAFLAFGGLLLIGGWLLARPRGGERR